MFQLIPVEHHGHKHFHMIIEARAAVSIVCVSLVCLGVGMGFVMEGRLYNRLPTRIADLYMKDLPEKVAKLEAQLRGNAETCDDIRETNYKLNAQVTTVAIEHQKQVEANEYLRSKLPTEVTGVAMGGM